MIRAGIQISRTSIRRILEEERCKTDRWRRHVPVPNAGDATHLTNPKTPHFVWHTDITEVRVLWKRFEIAAVLDGYSRKLLGIKVFNRRVATNDQNRLIKECAEQSGTTPRFLISDRGSQFRVQYTDACRAQGIVHVRCKVRVWKLNAMIERFFSTLKSWLRPSCLIPTEARIQERLKEFLFWYNVYRVYGAHTPNEQIAGIGWDSVRYTQRGGTTPTIRINRQTIRDDPKLFQLNIKVKEPHEGQTKCLKHATQTRWHSTVIILVELVSAHYVKKPIRIRTGFQERTSEIFSRYNRRRFYY